jgi:hypothetical protein
VKIARNLSNLQLASASSRLECIACSLAISRNSFLPTTSVYPSLTKEKWTKIRDEFDIGRSNIHLFFSCIAHLDASVLKNIDFVPTAENLLHPHISDEFFFALMHMASPDALVGFLTTSIRPCTEIYTRPFARKVQNRCVEIISRKLVDCKRHYEITFVKVICIFFVCGH